MKSKTHKLRKWILAILALGLLCAVALAGLNAVMVVGSSRYIYSPEDAAKLDADCILVLGCGLLPDGSPTAMLADRCDMGIRLYELGASSRLLMSGDHGQNGYDEVNTMKGLAVHAGIDADAVFCDHAGFSTYESMYRAGRVFEAKRIMIVTQKYHLYRAIYDARRLGLEAYGVATEERTYGGQLYRDARELLARAKDVIYCIFRPKPTFLGDAIPISGPGSLTDG